MDGGRVSSAAALERTLAEGAGVVTLTPGRKHVPATEEEYAGKRFVLNSRDAVSVSRAEAESCAAPLGGLAEIAAARRGGFDLGVGLDDGEEPTPYAAHLCAVRELRKRNVDCAVLFLRYPEAAEPFRERFRIHAEIARMYGGYKLGLRLSGISPALFRELRRECGGLLHLEPDAAAWKQIEAYFPV
ncbi:hypothetical protein SDC9_180797 [bioreactor metagenome]|uniref:Uncharacterized protein n=1 Tax=bioreactor metagenome TaxID=1076179 RepID=A0A645H4Q8_9ZZZZ